MDYFEPLHPGWKLSEIGAFQMYDIFPQYFLKPAKSEKSLHGKFIRHSFEESAEPLTVLENGYAFVKWMLLIWRILTALSWQPNYLSWKDIGVRNGEFCVRNPRGYKRIRYIADKPVFRVPSEVLVNCTTSADRAAFRVIPKDEFSTNPYLNTLIGNIIKHPNSKTIKLLEDDDYRFIGKHWNDLNALVKHFEAVSPPASRSS